MRGAPSGAPNGVLNRLHLELTAVRPHTGPALADILSGKEERRRPHDGPSGSSRSWAGEAGPAALTRSAGVGRGTPPAPGVERFGRRGRYAVRRSTCRTVAAYQRAPPC